jgi:circadian clock protein KaiB
MWKFRLYTAGNMVHSQRAIRNLRELCERYVPGRYELEFVDMYEEPERARTEHIIAAPTLVRLKPAPIMRLIGDLSDEATFCRLMAWEQVRS